MLQRLCKRIFEIIAPPFCYYCHAFIRDLSVPCRQSLCSDCKELVRPVISGEITISGSKIMRVFALGAYEDPLKTLILAKNNGASFASEQLGFLMAESMSLDLIACDLLVPVPLHWTRYAKRGFNQAEVIARILGSSMKKPVVNLLKRVKRTFFQASLQARQRFTNVEDAFVLDQRSTLLEGRHVVLVDDLMTTGATLATAARVIYAAGPASLNAIVACRAV